MRGDGGVAGEGRVVSAPIDYRPTEKGLETPQIYPGIDVTTRN